MSLYVAHRITPLSINGKMQTEIIKIDKTLDASKIENIAINITMTMIYRDETRIKELELKEKELDLEIEKEKTKQKECEEKTKQIQIELEKLKLEKSIKIEENKEPSTNKQNKSKIVINKLEDNEKTDLDIFLIDNKDIINQFIKDRCVLEKGNRKLKIFTKDLWPNFIDWTYEKHLRHSIKQPEFNNIISAITKHNRRTNVTIGKLRSTGWIGISLK